MRCKICNDIAEDEDLCEVCWTASEDDMPPSTGREDLFPFDPSEEDITNILKIIN